jgi:hypothetical protein
MTLLERKSHELVLAEFSVTHTKTAYPIDEPKIGNLFRRFASKLYNPHDLIGAINWDKILYCNYFDINVYDELTTNTVNRYLKLKFTTVDEFIDWINNNINNDGTYFLYECQIRIYSIVVNDFPRLDKIQGTNAFYSALVGTSGYLRIGSLINSIGNYTDANYQIFIERAWLEVWGRTITYSNDYKGTIWVQPKKEKNLYLLPYYGANIDSGVKPRKVYEIATGNVIDVTQRINFPINNSTIKYAVLQDADITNPIFCDKKSVFQNLFSGSNSTSAIILYGISDGNNEAIYIKPYTGIDTFALSKYDESLYRLETFATREGKRGRAIVIEPLPSDEPTATYGRRINRKLPMYLSGIGQMTARQRQRMNPSYAWKFKFYLRRIDTPYISEISKTGIGIKYQKGYGEGTGAGNQTLSFYPVFYIDFEK